MVTVAFDHVVEKFEKDADRFELNDTISEKLDEIASFFQENNIKGETIGRNKREPLFPITL